MVLRGVRLTARIRRLHAVALHTALPCPLHDLSARGHAAALRHRLHALDLPPPPAVVRGPDSFSAAVYNEWLVHCARHGHDAAVADIMARMRRLGLPLEGPALCRAARAYVDAGRVGRAAAQLEHVFAAGLLPDVATVRRVVGAQCRARRPEGAHALFARLWAAGVRTDAAPLCAAVRGYAACRAWAGLAALVAAAPPPLPPSAAGALVEVYAEHQLWGRAAAALAAAAAAGAPPPAVAYGRLAAALVAAQRPEAAAAVLEAMRSAGVAPPYHMAQTLSARARGLGAGAAEDAVAETDETMCAAAASVPVGHTAPSSEARSQARGPDDAAGDLPCPPLQAPWPRGISLALLPELRPLIAPRDALHRRAAGPPPPTPSLVLVMPLPPARRSPGPAPAGGPPALPPWWMVPVRPLPPRPRALPLPGPAPPAPWYVQAMALPLTRRLRPGLFAGARAAAVGRRGPVRQADKGPSSGRHAAGAALGALEGPLGAALASPRPWPARVLPPQALHCTPARVGVDAGQPPPSDGGRGLCRGSSQIIVCGPTSAAAQCNGMSAAGRQPQLAGCSRARQPPQP